MNVKNVINLGNISDTVDLPKGIVDKYYIYYKSDGDLYFYSSENDVELNLFKLGDIPKGMLSIDIIKINNGILSIDAYIRNNGILTMELTKTGLGMLNMSFTKVFNVLTALGSLNMSFTKTDSTVIPTGSINLNVKQYT